MRAISNLLNSLLILVIMYQACLGVTRAGSDIRTMALMVSHSIASFFSGADSGETQNSEPLFFGFTDENETEENEEEDGKEEDKQLGQAIKLITRTESFKGKQFNFFKSAPLYSTSQEVIVPPPDFS